MKKIVDVIIDTITTALACVSGYLWLVDGRTEFTTVLILCGIIVLGRVMEMSNAD